MKSKTLLYILLFSISLFSQNKNSSIGFIENKGQIIDQNGKPNNKVKYLLNTNGLNVQIRENGFSYDIYETKKHKLSKKEIAKQNPFPDVLQEKNKLPDYKLEYIYHRIDIDFLNSRKNIKIKAEEKSIDYDNYYNVIGKPEGVLNVHKYKQITYENIYPNIDVVFSIPNDSLNPVEYNFVVKPNGRISDIQLKFNGAKTELIDNKIKLNVRFGAMEEILPMSWIENGKSKTEVAINYKKLAKNVYGFESDVSSVDKTLIIDPVPIRLWGTYYGGNGSENRYESSIKSYQGGIYLVGYTESSSFIATTGSFQSIFYGGELDAFIARFDSNGYRMFGTYFGSVGRDAFRALDVDSEGNVYAVGETLGSNGLATLNSHQFNNNGEFDGMIVKLNNNGERLWSTYFGGNKTEFIICIAIDFNQDLIISGYTSSTTNISTPGSFHPIKYNPNINAEDGFLTKLTKNGEIIWSTYYSSDITAVDVDSNNNIFITGIAKGPDLTTIGCYDDEIAYDVNTGIYYYNAFFAKFSSTGTRLFGSYYGGIGLTTINCIKVDNNDDFIITGTTNSNSGIAMINSYQQFNNGGYDVFLAKFTNSGNLIWNTYFGGEESENIFSAIDLDESNNIFLQSSGESQNNIATLNAYQATKSGSIDSFIIKFTPLGQKIWGTYYGGSQAEYSSGISYAGNGQFYISGVTGSTNNIASLGAFQPNIRYNGDAYLVKFQDCLSSFQVISNNPCIGNTLNLNASGGTNYSWTGPNGFTSSIQNPVINNAQTIHSGQYSCTITGTGGCDGTISTTVTVGDNTKPIPNQTTLPTITGDCNTTISTIPTATDNCAGIINGTTTDAISYALPGTYTINWKYDDGNGNIETQQQSIVITTVALPTLTSPQTFCIQQNATLNSISISGQNIKWYDAQTLGNLLPSSAVLTNDSTYYASQTINSCESLRVPITINIQNTPAPTGNANQSFCSTQNATLNEIVISGSTLKWYSSPLSTVTIPNTTLLVNGSTYYATQTINGCESINRLAVTITLTTTLNANNYSKSFCDDLDDGFETILLSDYNSFLLPSVTNEIFTYYNSNSSAENQILSDEINQNYTLTTGNHIVFVRIDSSNGCHQVVELNLTLFSNPVINLKDIIPICENKDITVNAGNGFDSYTWSTGITNHQSILITQPGSYSLTVTKNNGSITCSSTKNFTVVNSNIASISSIETSDWTDNQNTISVFLSPSSVGNYEYSLDGIKYQDSPIFDNLISGFYTVYVNDKNNCGEITDEAFILMYSTFFTPNNDGFNDYWKIKLSELEPGLSIKIFDRYGKFIKLLDNDDIGWDGTLNQKPLIADDYWFVITRANGKEYRNHFTLKR